MNTYWLIIAVLFLIIEILTPGIFLFACFSIGAVVAFIISFFSKSLILQSSLFAISSVLSIYFLKPLLTKYIIPKVTKSNVDELVGMYGFVVEQIEGQKVAGLVKIKNELWRAVSETNEKIDKDTEVEVLKIDGTHLIVRSVKK